jgi:hypothetical protein
MHSSHSESDLSDDVCVFDRSLSVQKLVLGFRQMSLVNQMQSFACVMEL